MAQAISPRSSKASRWRAAVLLLVHLILGLHILHWLVTGRSLGPLEPSEGMAFSKQGVVNVGLMLFAVAILSCAVFGRFFCGWACHMVALQDLALAFLKRLGIRPKPLRSRLLALVPLFGFGYMYVVPWIYRAWTGGGVGVREVEWTTEHFWDNFPGWGVGLATLAICGFVVIYFLGAKGYCTYACPYGAILGAVDGLAPNRIRVNDDCQQCGHCTAACTSNVQVHREVRDFGMVVDAGCMKCLDCVSVCPNGALRVGFGTPAVLAKPRVADFKKPARPKGAPSWLEEIVLVAGFLLGFFGFRGYFVVPFLFSLGIGGLVAWFALALSRLLGRRDLSMGGKPMRKEGRWTGVGMAMAFLAALVVLSAAWGSLLRWEAHLRDKHFALTARSRAVWFQLERGEGEILIEEQSHHAASLKHALRIERWNPWANPQNQLELAWLRLMDGDEASFEAGMKEVVAAAPRQTQFRMDLAHFLIWQGRYPEARQELQQCFQYHRRKHQLWAELGLLEVLASNLDEALRCFEQGLQALGEGHPAEEARLRTFRIQVLREQGETERAEAEERKIEALYQKLEKP
ncbi:MAG: 4Fe-4S binding protein [Planctomycetota bacterium]|nr:MAG: 4Fe-4S binding protein [Planctomycetota bacterium]